MRDEDDFSGITDASQMGRLGGIITILVGAPVCGAFVYLGIVSGDYVWSAPGALLGLVLVLVGIMGYRRGARARIVPHMSVGSLRGVVQTQALGFTVCARCRVVMPGNLLGSCTSCLSPAECVVVTTEEDRKTALAAIPRQ